MEYHFRSFQDSKSFLEKYGFAVITNVIDEKECEELSIRVIGEICELCNISKWENKILLPQSRKGLFDFVIGNLPSVWDIRTHRKVIDIFEQFYGTRDLLPSIEGVSIVPDGTLDNGSDWAHLEKTFVDAPKLMSQVVLNDSDACFKCSPGSHKIFEKIISTLDIESKKAYDQFHIFKTEELEIVRPLVLELSDEIFPQNWQRKIKAPIGSVIVWHPELIWSFGFSNKVVNGNLLENWRITVNVSHHPRSQLTKRQLTLLKSAIQENRTTDWACSRLLQKKPHHFNKKLYSKRVFDLVNNPKILYEIFENPINDI